MLFNSTFKDNLERKKVEVEIGQISAEDYNETFLCDLDKMINKIKIDRKEIRFYKQNIQINEFRWQDVFVIYYNRDETDKEYNERIEKLQVKDLIEFFKVLGQYNVSLTQKPEIKALYDKLCVEGKHKGLLPDWQKEQLDNFFTKKTIEEAISQAYKRGLAEGKKQTKEIKDKLKELSEDD